MGLKLSKASMEDMLPTKGMLNMKTVDLLNRTFVYKKDVMPTPRAGETLKINLNATDADSGADNGRINMLFLDNESNKRVTLGVRGLLFTDVIPASNADNFVATYGPGADGKISEEQAAKRAEDLKPLHDALNEANQDAADGSVIELPNEFTVKAVEDVYFDKEKGVKRWPFYMYSAWKLKSAGKTPEQVSELFRDFDGMSAMYSTGAEGLSETYRAKSDENCVKTIFITTNI